MDLPLPDTRHGRPPSFKSLEPFDAQFNIRGWTGGMLELTSAGPRMSSRRATILNARGVPLTTRASQQLARHSTD